MIADPAARARPAAAVGLIALAACWIGVFAGSARQPGYEPLRDRISPIAAHGADAAWIGIGAILLLALAYGAGALVLREWVGTRAGGWLMTGAAAATAVVALARLDCPGGARGCARNEGGNRLIGPASDGTEGLIHSGAVIVAYALVATAMVVVALIWRRRGRRLLAALSVGALVTSLATVPFWTTGDHPGFVQRVWLGILGAWLVLVLLRPLTDGRSPEEAR